MFGAAIDLLQCRLRGRTSMQAADGGRYACSLTAHIVHCMA
jgi:hypothetical protein